MTFLAFAENTIQLIPDGTLLFHLFTVVVMVAVLNRTLFRPINKVLADREAQISGRAGEAKKLRDDIETSLSRYERGLREARTAGYHLVEIERTQALKLREEKVIKVREEILTELTREKTEIERQAAEAREALLAEAIKTAAVIGSQILHRPVSDSAIPRDY